MNPIALRLLNQQLICPQFDNPTEVVDYMGAMQAQEYRMMRWAVGMRTRKPSAKAFKRAFDDGQIIRLHLMRGTWQLVSAENYWPLLELCAPKAMAVTKGWMNSNKISIPDEEVVRTRKIQGFRKGKYLLIPPYDEYLISYKSRDIVLLPDYKHKAHNNRGIFQPVITYDGVICGNWTPFKENCQVEFFMGNHSSDIQKEWTIYKRFLER